MRFLAAGYVHVTFIPLEEVFSMSHSFETVAGVWEKLQLKKTEFMNVGVAPGDSIFVPFGTLCVTLPVLSMSGKGIETSAWYCENIISVDNAKAVQFSGTGEKTRFPLSQLIEAGAKAHPAHVGSASDKADMKEFVKGFKDYAQPVQESDDDYEDKQDSLSKSIS